MGDNHTATSSQRSLYKRRGGAGRLLFATRNSLAGLRTAVQSEAAFRQLLLLSVVLLPLAMVLEVSRAERALLVAVVLLALIVELLNSALEAAVDRISLEEHPLSGQAKDMGSAAQMLALILIAAVWGAILL